jgi:hypothetical protein
LGESAGTPAVLSRRGKALTPGPPSAVRCPRTAPDVIWGNVSFGLRPYDPLAWAASNGIASERIMSALAELLLQDDLAPQARDLVLAPGRDGTPNGLRKALQRLLHCPEFQLS